jgi:hypothetical protein
MIIKVLSILQAIVLSSALVIAGAARAGSDSEPPALPPCNARPLLEIIEILESKGYDPIIEMEFEDDYWEVEAFRENTLVEVRVHSVTGLILPDPPPTDQIPIAEVVEKLEQAGYRVVVIELEGSEWEIEAYRYKAVDVRIDPESGAIQESLE